MNNIIMYIFSVFGKLSMNYIESTVNIYYREIPPFLRSSFQGIHNYTNNDKVYKNNDIYRFFIQIRKESEDLLLYLFFTLTNDSIITVLSPFVIV